MIPQGQPTSLDFILILFWGVQSMAASRADLLYRAVEGVYNDSEKSAVVILHHRASFYESEGREAQWHFVTIASSCHTVASSCLDSLIL